ncbi:GNAT family N-acetyltransferase [Oscillospiraceae bacterium MB08-C2-2]|nr:GNAT family N-acetyltransferase [Oscillospiraceae bacterium MB08-C2-2]
MLIKTIAAEHRLEARSLIEAVFMQYDAPDYSAQGVSTFQCILADQSMLERLDMLGAYIENKLVGVLATKNSGAHITFFFVDGRYHRKGIGKELFKQMLEQNSQLKITVNSSPYAVDVYRRLGFAPDGDECTTDGIRYTPMTYSRMRTQSLSGE